MRSIDTKVGKVYYKDGVFVLEKNFKTLSLLMAKEKSIKDKIAGQYFNILKSYWFIADNPYYDIERVITNDASKVRFIYKLELEYTK
jgi:ribosome-associated toxin RatA of RatAB toxin-antitoxin module